jgi:hypothetical protein
MNVEQFSELVNTLGIPGTHTVATTAAAADIPKLLFRTIGRAEEQLVNAYGADAAVIITLAASGTISKFDEFKLKGMRYIVQAVMPRFDIDTGNVMGYTNYCKGGTK